MLYEDFCTWWGRSKALFVWKLNKLQQPAGIRCLNLPYEVHTIDVLRQFLILPQNVLIVCAQASALKASFHFIPRRTCIWIFLVGL